MIIQDIRPAQKSAPVSSHLNNWRRGGGGERMGGGEDSIKNALSEADFSKDIWHTASCALLDILMCSGC